MAFAFVEFTKLKKLLGLDKDDVEDYPQLEFLVESVQDAIEDYCGRLFEYATVTNERVNLSFESRMVPLLRLPIESITEVRVVTSATSSTTTAYEITPYGIRLDIAHGGYSSQFDYENAVGGNVWIEVDYVGGYETSPPGPVQRAAYMQMGYEYQNIDNIGAQSVTTEGGTINRPELGLLKEVKSRLQKYIHPAKMGAGF